MRPWLTDDELRRIEAAVRAAEQGTTAEIVVVITGDTAGPSWLLWPAFLALAVPLATLILWPGVSAGTLYALQLGVLALGLVLSLVPGLRRLLTPVAVRQASVRQCARDQFFERGLHLTAARTGILLLVSPGDRHVEIVVDAGAQGTLSDQTWDPCLKVLLAAARQGQLAAGIEAAIGMLGDVLRERLPAGSDDRNTIPDRPVLL